MQSPIIYCQQETHLNCKHSLNVKEYTHTHTYYINANPKKAGIAILVSKKLNFKTRIIIRDIEGQIT